MVSRLCRAGGLLVLLLLLACATTATSAQASSDAPSEATPATPAATTIDPPAAVAAVEPVAPVEAVTPVAVAEGVAPPAPSGSEVATDASSVVEVEVADDAPAVAPAAPVPAAVDASAAAKHTGHAASDHARLHRAPPGGKLYPHAGHLHNTDPSSTVLQHGSHAHTLADAEAHGGLIFGTMLAAMCAAQLGLVLWKRHSPTTFDQATLVALWLFPIGYAIWHGVTSYLRLIFLWGAFSIVCCVVMRAAVAQPIARTTPRLVYSYFHWVYRISYGTAVLGYAVMMAHFLGVAEIVPWLVPAPSTAILLGFYGLYFGVLGRDLAHVCSQRLAISLGFVAKRGEMPRRAVPANVCAICAGELVRSFRPAAGGGVAPDPEEPIHTLNCSHCFHSTCLRGWTLIGKRDTCAACGEKVAVSKDLKKQPWERTSLAWAWLLDALRYLIVFNPIVLIVAQGALYLIY